MLAEHVDVPLDFDSVMKVNSRLGTACVVVVDDRTCPIGMLENMERFFARESCGFCTPCRDGLPWTAKLLRAFEEGHAVHADIARLALHTKFLGPGFTYCALAPGAMSPLESGLTYFRDEFERHIAEGGCPYRRDAA
jgi:NADH-quinone oxidoreductase subunit F